MKEFTTAQVAAIRTFEMVEGCRFKLKIQGFISDNEDAKIIKRLAKFAEKNGFEIKTQKEWGQEHLTKQGSDE